MKRATYNDRWTLWLPDVVADWDAIAGWEIQRFLSMERNLRDGWLLYDVGAEHGGQSAIYAGFVGGGENTVLVEPTESFWPNIRRTWEANGLRKPRLMFPGLLDATPSDLPDGLDQWPSCSVGDEAPVGGYRYLHETDHSDVPRATLDQLADVAGPPDAITIDVEGAELLVLRGADRMLRTARPAVWVSIHPDMSERDYGTTRMDLLRHMEALAYEAHNLQVDHEEHWCFWPLDSIVAYDPVPR